MFNFIIGCVIGFVVATFGLSNVVSMIDNNIDTVKEKIEDNIQK
tara:strand:- start:210 stop:341 length:132 start_codon:yes stop_codon:yes gene_type:complete